MNDSVYQSLSAVLNFTENAIAACAADKLPALPSDACAKAAFETVGIMSGAASKRVPLRRRQPVFTHLGSDKSAPYVPPQPLGSTLPAYDGNAVLTAGDCASLADGFRRASAAAPKGRAGVDAVLRAAEKYTSSLPSVFGGDGDISLYSELRLAAAVSSCLAAEGFDGSEAFDRSKQYFLLCSADFSGIQKFIYSVSTAGALAALRSRSFFLELLMAHYTDETVHLGGVSPANVIYSGGGHCYLLLPNLPGMADKLDAWNEHFNTWLLEQFDIRLFLAHGYAPCSADDLCDVPAEKAPYEALFRRVSSMIAQKKLRRYTPEQLRKLNAVKDGTAERECRVCARTDQLTQSEKGGELCPWCLLFERLSGLLGKDSVFVTTDTKVESGLRFSLPTADGSTFVTVLPSEKDAQKVLETAVPRRVYIKSENLSLPYSTRIPMGDYTSGALLNDLAGASSGIKRLGVCRMDVDNLGHAFVSGFARRSEADPAARSRYVNLLRTSEFSRQMSLFFKHYINTILGEGNLNVSIVYSGGDDAFIVGAWDDVMDAAVRIHDALDAFGLGSLTVSAGIGLYKPTYPIRSAAELTAELEDTAKGRPGKDSISLFAPEERYAFSWKDFKEDILAKKIKLLWDFFTGDNERGRAFLYRLLELMRAADENGSKIEIARCAYMLTRLEPPKNSPKQEIYKAFTKEILRCMTEDRRRMIAAIYLYVYSVRGVEEA